MRLMLIASIFCLLVAKNLIAQVNLPQSTKQLVLDQDSDEIDDSLDECPSEKEIINFYLDQDGCPDEKPDQIKEGVIAGLTFELGTANLTPNYDSILAPIYSALKAYPGTEIEIGAHVDNKAGTDAKAITYAQAKAVVAALYKMGIETRRMQAVGYGFARPLVQNRTANGREQNRRIEIHKLN